MNKIHGTEELIIQAIESFSVIGPDGWKKEEPDLVQFISPSTAHGAMNAVVRARFDLDVMDVRIDDALRPYIERKRNCWWMIGPNSTHHTELETRLMKRGFELEHDAFGLAISTDTPIHFNVDSSVSVEKISSDTLEDYLRASRDGVEPSENYRSYFEWLLETHKDGLELFLSRVNGEPAGTGLIQVLNGTANLVSGFVRPQFRGLGAYRILIRARVERLKDREIPVAVVLSKAQTSAPILMQMGFKKISRIRTLELKQS